MNPVNYSESKLYKFRPEKLRSLLYLYTDIRDKLTKLNSLNGISGGHTAPSHSLKRLFFYRDCHIDIRTTCTSIHLRHIGNAFFKLSVTFDEILLCVWLVQGLKPTDEYYGNR